MEGFLLKQKKDSRKKSQKLYKKELNYACIYLKFYIQKEKMAMRNMRKYWEEDANVLRGITVARFSSSAGWFAFG